MPSQVDAMLEIRPAQRADLAAILALHAELEFDAERAVLDLRSAEKLFDRIASYPSYKLYVASSAEKIVGTFALLIMDNLAHLGAPSGIVEDVVVHPEYQGLGIGKQMMQFAMERCKQAGCYKLALSSNAKREQAHQFYENMGFEKHGYSFLISLSP